MHKSGSCWGCLSPMPFLPAIKVLMEDGLLESLWCWLGPQEADSEVETDVLEDFRECSWIDTCRREGRAEGSGEGSRGKWDWGRRTALADPTGSSEAEMTLQTGPHIGWEGQTFVTPAPPQLLEGWGMSLTCGLQPRQFLKRAESWALPGSILSIWGNNSFLYSGRGNLESASQPPFHKVSFL